MSSLLAEGLHAHTGPEAVFPHAAGLCPLSASRSSTSRTMSSGPVPRFKTYSLRSRSPAWNYSCSHALRSDAAERGKRIALYVLTCLVFGAAAFAVRSESVFSRHALRRAFLSAALGGRMAACGTAPAAHRLAVGAAVRTAPAALRRRTRAARRKNISFYIFYPAHFLLCSCSGNGSLQPFAKESAEPSAPRFFILFRHRLVLSRPRQSGRSSRS